MLNNLLNKFLAPSVFPGVVFIVLVFTGCKKEAVEVIESAQIKIDGSSTVYPITDAVVAEYLDVTDDVSISAKVSGTGGGFKRFVTGEIDIADASRPIKDSEREAATANGIDFVEITVAYDGLVVVTHPENEWLDSIKVEELKKIWAPKSQRKVTQWNHVNELWPEEEIHLFAPGYASGTYDYFTEVITGRSRISRLDYFSSEDDKVLVDKVGSDVHSLGFFGLSYFTENQELLKWIAIDNGSGPILPTLGNIKQGRYSPLSRSLYIYVSSETVKNPQKVAFINFYLDKAAEYSRTVGYIPLSDEEYNEQRSKFQAFVEEVNSTEE